MLGVLIVGAVVWLVRRSQQARNVPEDREEDLAPTLIQEQLLGGRLSPQDLVFEDGNWGTLLNSAQFGETAASREDKLTRLRKFRMGLMVLAGTMASLAIFGALTDFGRFFVWLLNSCCS